LRYAFALKAFLTPVRFAHSRRKVKLRKKKESLWGDPQAFSLRPSFYLCVFALRFELYSTTFEINYVKILAKINRIQGA